MVRFILILFFCVALIVGSCSHRGAIQPADNQAGWEQVVTQQLPLLGHRNWILIVDKAFPWQTSSGMTYIDSGSGLPDVLSHVLALINNSAHIKPIIYRDTEIDFIDEKLATGVEQFNHRISSILGEMAVQQMPHEDVFRKMDEAAALFQVLVIKTEETIPYSSVFIELDCAYWDDEREKQLRMKQGEINEN